MQNRTLYFGDNKEKIFKDEEAVPPKTAELELFAEKARKYKSAEEFVKKQIGIRNLVSIEGYAKRGVIDQLVDFWNIVNKK